MAQKQKIIAQGAEAIIFLDEKNNQVIKKRIKKSYRIPEIDETLRKLRTRGEARLMRRANEKAKISVPRIIKEDEKNRELIIEYIKGKKLSEHLNELKDKEKICKEIGKQTAKMHDEEIIHGDLTTSNMILQDKTNKIFFIDFGLSFHSKKIEDKAVDIHLFKQALEARHFQYYSELLKSFLKGYKSGNNFKETIERLKKVEARGRYKH